jgi:hypothetical protein
MDRRTAIRTIGAAVAALWLPKADLIRSTPMPVNTGFVLNRDEWQRLDAAIVLQASNRLTEYKSELLG